MAVAQQIILDKINGTPGGSGDLAINSKNQGNAGFLVQYGTPQSSDTINLDAYAAPSFHLLQVNTGITEMQGVLLDVHNLATPSHKGLITVGRKGRFKIIYDYNHRPARDSDIGSGIAASTTEQGHCEYFPSNGIGEIVGWGANA